MTKRPPDSPESFMEIAVKLARKGHGFTSPNPAVGAVIVKKGAILGKGWHQRAGGPHAEIAALEQVFRNGHSKKLKGADLYVTLEPCSTWGRTPPCVDSILKSGIQRVFIGAVDPNPHHSGRGLTKLRKAGIRVQTAILREECENLISRWAYWIRNNSPWVTAKCAMTLDGRIATEKGESKWISCEKSRIAAHQLRAGVDAVLVGINTVLRDDPALDVRYKIPHRPGFPVKIIMDREARTPPASRLFKKGAPVWIVVSAKAPISRVKKLETVGATILKFPGTQNDGERSRWRKFLRMLGKRDITSVMVEGGGNVLGTFFDLDLVHEVSFFVAPKVLGGRYAVRAISGRGKSRITHRIDPRSLSITRIADDLHIQGKFCPIRAAKPGWTND
jgi:diaminohydroxyphosphoribosylaminopyrimidine deaminase / 5-amino-6-(5-phosphoribosylamino)uracil reductase